MKKLSLGDSEESGAIFGRNRVPSWTCRCVEIYIPWPVVIVCDYDVTTGWKTKDNFLCCIENATVRDSGVMVNAMVSRHCKRRLMAKAAGHHLTSMNQGLCRDVGL